MHTPPMYTTSTHTHPDTPTPATTLLLCPSPFTVCMHSIHPQAVTMHPGIHLLTLSHQYTPRPPPPSHPPTSGSCEAGAGPVAPEAAATWQLARCNSAGRGSFYDSTAGEGGGGRGGCWLLERGEGESGGRGSGGKGCFHRHMEGVR
jgi:hypothetical protein